MLRGTGTSTLRVVVPGRSSSTTDTTQTMSMARPLYNKRVRIKLMGVLCEGGVLSSTQFLSNCKLTFGSASLLQNIEGVNEGWQRAYSTGASDLEDESVGNSLVVSLRTNAVVNITSTFQSFESEWYDLGVIHELPSRFSVRADCYTCAGANNSKQPQIEVIMQIEDAVEE